MWLGVRVVIALDVDEQGQVVGANVWAKGVMGGDEVGRENGVVDGDAQGGGE